MSTYETYPGAIPVRIHTYPKYRRNRPASWSRATPPLLPAGSIGRRGSEPSYLDFFAGAPEMQLAKAV